MSPNLIQNHKVNFSTLSPLVCLILLLSPTARNLAHCLHLLSLSIDSSAGIVSLYTHRKQLIHISTVFLYLSYCL